LKSTENPLLFWLLVTAFVLFSAAAGAGWLYGPDVFLIRAAQSWSSDLPDAIVRVLSVVGSWEFTVALLLVLVAGLFLGGRRRLAGRLLLAFLITGSLEYLLKQFLPVPPIPPDFARAEDLAPLMAVGYSYPYPSGHALRCTILLGAVYLLSRNVVLRAAIALVLSGLLAGRVYLGVHWPSDVVGGALLGAAAVLWASGEEHRGWR